MSLSTHTSETSSIIKAPREAVYKAFIDPADVATWLAGSSGIRPEDNDEGSRQSLRKLANLLE
ncbi:hypothetical protein [Chitinophaga eiseniae]|uniref:Activator of Hsp90 ATPase homolog 1-like protein n=1 Tax=Chitinophaga eiseniae TaxID=634771 RepID=A0A847S4D0_9BACT|nr:hypothetical protein [Chitinophaga eiseniae]NLR78150.1 hypothetical protein [Chitinophaga eiseniae]